ncbi:hypothetical protein EVAR_9446_1 [Eumeta japonica]|uniref:Uncharacterized protein n=1 Tax=Eumeta variegata TaxID=151549 RepID=A0A4C1UD97_EUMVA|nr:hypothetical protein EVAR_9446_1 [Eumeta japonica]
MGGAGRELVAEQCRKCKILSTSHIVENGVGGDRASVSSTRMQAMMRLVGLWLIGQGFIENAMSACSNDNGTSSDRVQQEADEFSQTLPTKSEKIYPNTLNLQPIRQINLPDTHIYTPTDSEIPRSKTIHYDIGAPILIPQLANDTTKTKYDTSENDVADDEYSEFQNFQCGTNLHPHSVNPQPPDKDKQNNSIIETIPTFNLESNSVLQPIKVEPKLPTLNWPDPGEVKEMFEDFSDFAAHSVWNKNKENEIPDSMNTLKSEVPLFSTVTNTSDTAVTPISLNTNSHIDKNICMTDFDDEFDTFQSALPISNSSQAFQTLSTDIKEIEKPMDSDRVQTITPEQFINKTKESEFSSFVLSDLNQLSDYNNSGDCMTLKMVNQAVNENGAVSTPVSTIAKTTTLTHNSLVADTKILHPIPASSVVTNHSKQASGQILQPLSLESYTQINWPNPGISLQDLSAFNPVKTIQTIKSEASGSHSKNATPSHVQKNQATDDEMWSDFVSVNPKTNPQLKKQTFTEDDEWSDFVSSPNVNPHNGLNTISLNVHTNLSKQNSLAHSKHKQVNKHIDIPTLNYITPKSNTNRAYTDRHFQNL